MLNGVKKIDKKVKLQTFCHPEQSEGTHSHYMLVIRLTKTGHKGEAKYRIVVTEKRYKRDGKPAEYLGWVVKTAKGITKDIKMDRVKYWLAQGAQPSAMVKKLIA